MGEAELQKENQKNASNKKSFKERKSEAARE